MSAFTRVFVLTVAALFPALPASADPVQGLQAEAFIQTLSDSALEAVASDMVSPAVQREKLMGLLTDGFDVPRIGQLALGRNWNAATSEQRVEYLDLFRETIFRTYDQKFTGYSGQKVKVTGHKIGKRRKYIFVQSKIYNPDHPKANIDLIWRVLAKDAEFKVIDIVIEGVSMVLAQRKEYDSVIQRSDGEVAGLIGAMRENLAKLEMQDNARNQATRNQRTAKE